MWEATGCCFSVLVVGQVEAGGRGGCLFSIGSRIVRGGGGGSRNMKYKAPQVAAIFFMASFNMDRGGPWPPCPPLGSAAGVVLLSTVVSTTGYMWEGRDRLLFQLQAGGGGDEGGEVVLLSAVVCASGYSPTLNIPCNDAIDSCIGSYVMLSWIL